MSGLSEQGPAIALPARALRARLHWDAEPPSWATYLPPLLLQQAAQTDGARAAGSCGLPPAAGVVAAPAGRAWDDATCAPGTWGPATLPPSRKLASAEQQIAVGAAVPTVLQPSPFAGAWWFGRVWALAQDPQGCRDVQAAFEAADSEEERAALASELRGHTCEALRCPHANYVLQKCIAMMSAHRLDFVVDELAAKGPGTVAYSARHKYGCRIVQRMLEHCLPSQVQGIAEHLLQDAIGTCLHPYGNYVMQHLLEFGTAEQRSRLTRLLLQHIAVVGADPHACAVVGKAMTYGARGDQVSLARGLLLVPGLIASMARSRHGHVAAKLILNVLEGPELEEACSQLLADADCLRNSRYGQLVLASLKSEGPGRSKRAHAVAAGGG
mmetsp:Transcript_46737/g.99847  ORF Transcript_46737/g.99847 Transcript_46737/m.99847 type:complete len:384 (-) Transcript_46737:117-1268(-)